MTTEVTKKESIDLTKENTNQIKESIDLTKENTNTIKENIIPIKENIIPIKENTNQIKENINQIKENINPLKEPNSYNIAVPFEISGKTNEGLFDLNKIFQINLNYNFDLLKSFLEGIITTQKNTEKELQFILEESKIKDKKLKELEKKLQNFNKFISTNSDESKLSEDASKDNNQSKISHKKKISSKLASFLNDYKKMKKIHEPQNKDIKLEISIQNSDTVNDIIVSI